jgi:CRISPR-associated protein Cas5h
VRKDPPAPFSWRVKATDKGSSSAQRNFRFPQEWLWQPCFRVWAALPAPYQAELAGRLRDRRWHFTPCMGLSEMLADLAFVHEDDGRVLPMDTHPIGSVVPRDSGQVDTSQAADAGLTLQSLRMPAAVTEDRVFSHRTYWIEHQGRPFPFTTAHAFRCGPDIFVFL